MINAQLMQNLIFLLFIPLKSEILLDKHMARCFENVREVLTSRDNRMSFDAYMGDYLGSK